MIPQIYNEKKLLWEDCLTKEIHNDFKAENIALALTGQHFNWLRNNKPDILDFVLVKGKFRWFQILSVFCHELKN